MSLVTLSQSIFDERSALAIKSTPIRKEVPLRSIEVVSDEMLTLDGKAIRMTENSFKSICKIVGLPIGFNKTFTKSFGDNARQQLVNRLKTATQSKGNTTVSLVVNPQDRRIISVQKTPKELVSNETFVRTASRVIDENSLSVLDYTIGSDGGVVINTASLRSSWGIKGLKNEDFYSGISFTNSPQKGFEISLYLNRLICANGMMGTSFLETFPYLGTSPKSMEDFQNGIQSLANAEFRPRGFEDKVRLATQTPASFREMENAHELIRKVSDANFSDVEPWIPFGSTRERFHQAGIDTIDLSRDQKKAAKTGTSVWDLVNGITHFATHDNNFNVDEYDRRRLQAMAASILSSDFDIASLIKSPF